MWKFPVWGSNSTIDLVSTSWRYSCNSRIRCIWSGSKWGTQPTNYSSAYRTTHNCRTYSVKMRLCSGCSQISVSSDLLNQISWAVENMQFPWSVLHLHLNPGHRPSHIFATISRVGVFGLFRRNFMEFTYFKHKWTRWKFCAGEIYLFI